jgi:VWFA-related protein
MSALSRTALVVLLGAPLALSASLWAQSRPNPLYPGSQPGTAESQRFETTSTAIVVDVVVRDRKGQLIRDLTADDFELFEDRLRQTIGSFSIADRGEGIALTARRRNPPTQVTTSPAGSGEDQDDTSPGVMALVFDRLSPESRVLAQQAALSGIPMSGRLPDQTGVFAVDLSVNLVQPFTRDAASVRQALGSIGGLNASQFQPRDRRIVELQEDRIRLTPLLATTVDTARSVAGATSTQAIGSIEMELWQNRMEGRMLEIFDTLEREQQGYSTTNALLSVVASLQEIPGRKTLVFFSEGLAVPPAAQSAFQSVVDTANRANVTIYSVDASGLRAESMVAEARRELTATGTERIVQIESGSQPISGSLLRMLERNEDLMRMDPHTGLGDLSRDTGGFLVRDTNDLRSAFARIEEDMQFHYVLTYAPQNQDFDGRFREVDVKVKRPGARVFARRGYFAVRSLGPSPLLGYEALPLAALDRTPLPNDFPVSSTSLSFPEPKRPGLTPVVVRLATNTLTYDVNKGGGTYNAEAAVVVRFKDQQGRVLHKTSQHYLLSGRLDELEAARSGEILFYRQPDLLPGAYTVETMAYDLTGGKGSARVATVVVPGGRFDRTRLSSVVVVGRAESVAADERDAENPLYAGDLLLYPRGTSTLIHGRDAELVFFYTVYPAVQEPVDATIELLAAGRVLSRAPAITLDAPDEDGRIQQVQRIPIDALPAGSYELRVTVRDRTGSESRSARFTIAGS